MLMYGIVIHLCRVKTTEPNGINSQNLHFYCKILHLMVIAIQIKENPIKEINCNFLPVLVLAV